MWIFISFFFFFLLRFELTLLTMKFHFRFFIFFGEFLSAGAFWSIRVRTLTKNWIWSELANNFSLRFFYLASEFVEPRALHSKVGRTEIMKSRTRLFEHKARCKMSTKVNDMKNIQGSPTQPIFYAISREMRDDYVGMKRKKFKVEWTRARGFWMLKLGQMLCGTSLTRHMASCLLRY